VLDIFREKQPLETVRVPCAPTPGGKLPDDIACI